jgi:CRISPR system Cascade subunit CasC
MTYDRRQLQRNWTGWSGPNADALLRSFVRNATLSLPQGKKNSTSADTMPDLIIAEAQGSRTGYQFQTPIVADVDGGYLRPSTAALYAQACAARSFDSRNFGATVVSGLSAVGRPAQVPDAAVVDMDGLTDFIVDWLRA